MKIHDGELIEMLRRAEIFQRYVRDFRRVTGFPVSLTDPDAPGRPPSQDSNRFCRMLARCSAACDACQKFHDKMLSQDARKPQTRRCLAGFSYTTLPVMAAGRTMAFLEIGPVSLRQPTEKDFDRAAVNPPLNRIRGNRNRLRNAFLATRTTSPSRYRSMVGLLVEFSHQLGELTARALLHSESDEPGAVARARAFIEAHSIEDLYLPDVAKAAHVSPAYLSELFHKTTHCSFTDYVARLRVEKSKRLLLAPESRVLEAAFEAGFQSLSQFNRAFKRITGMTPVEFRSSRS
jgi:AraC-like DNA-binding protein